MCTSVQLIVRSYKNMWRRRRVDGTNSARHHRFGRRLRLDDARALIRPPVLARYSRVTIIRGQTILAIAGALLFVFSPSTPLALAGVLLWGVGASLGFPVA